MHYSKCHSWYNDFSTQSLPVGQYGSPQGSTISSPLHIDCTLYLHSFFQWHCGIRIPWKCGKALSENATKRLPKAEKSFLRMSFNLYSNVSHWWSKLASFPGPCRFCCCCEIHQAFKNYEVRLTGLFLWSSDQWSYDLVWKLATLFTGNYTASQPPEALKDTASSPIMNANIPPTVIFPLHWASCLNSAYWYLILKLSMCDLYVRVQESLFRLFMHCSGKLVTPKHVHCSTLVKWLTIVCHCRASPTLPHFTD